MAKGATGSAVTEAALIVIAVMAPFTLLRVGLVGIAECLLGAMVLWQVFRPLALDTLRQLVLTRFWLAYLVFCAVGAVVNWMLLDRSTGTPGSALFDTGSYLFIFAACFTLERVILEKAVRVDILVLRVFVWSSATLSVLYAVSFITDNLFGLSLTYFGYFCPFAQNIHQVAMYLAPLTFMGIAAFATTPSVLWRVAIVALILADIVMSFATGSTKGVMAIVLGTLVFVYSGTIRAGGRRAFVPVSAMYLAVAAAFVLASDIDLYATATTYFAEQDKGDGRAFLYGKAINVGADSFLFGRGPGGHIETANQDVYYDAHQTFLTAYLQAGIMGVVVLMALFAAIARRALFHPAMLGAFAAVAVYALGGDILRRLPAWFVLALITHYGFGTEHRWRRRFPAKPAARPNREVHTNVPI